MSFDAAFSRALDGGDLSREQMSDAMRALMSGDVDVARTAAFLAALRVKGETLDEIVAAADTMRSFAAHLKTASPVIDTCGTGGSGAHVFNVSSASAAVAAAAGAKVAKHGNRAVSGKTGSADVLEAAGVELELDAHGVAECIERVGAGFVYARSFHTAMKHVAPVRQALATRTIFNLLGPLSNPARPAAQVIGVFSPQWLEPLALATHELGMKRAVVLHSDDGLDEISIAAPTRLIEQRDGELKRLSVRPSDFGLEEAALDDVRVGDVAAGLEMMRAALAGEHRAASDMLAMNAAAALVVADIAADLADGVARAQEVIASGAATAKLDEWAAVSRQLAGKSVTGSRSAK